MPVLPAGTVTFLFADVEVSASASQRLGPRYPQVLRQCVRLLGTAFQKEGGQEVGAEGRVVLVAFRRARDAVAAAVAAQRVVAAKPWPKDVPLRVRIGLYSGEATSTPVARAGLHAHLAARICSIGHGGQILVSGSTRRLLEQDLPSGVSLRDLGGHRLRDLQRVEHLFQVVHPGLPADFPPLKSLDAFPNNLPTQLTSFIGRDQEIVEVKRTLTTTRLLTLTGTGGCGKTRLALHVAAEVLEQYSDGVWFIELATLSNPTLIPQAIASVLGVPEQPGRPLGETLLGHLRPKVLLLLLDNCEHLLPGCAQLTDALLRGCPNLRLLATSRAVLGIAGEIARRVPSLSLPSLPTLHRLPPVTHLMDAEAVRLFVERATACAPTFAVTDQNAAAVLHVCSQLDGIPLAIELAAARMKVLAVEQIAARLEDQFRLLTGGGRTILPRHRTLRAAMDWSHDLLSEKERIMWRRLSVFAGGWTLEAADAVCSGTDVQAADILDLLSQLVDKSLVVVNDQAGKVRFRLPQTVRQYGRDRLEEAGEAAEVRRRHRDWYLELAERADPELRGPALSVWLGRLETEHDNLRAALEWTAAETGNADMALRFAGALHWFWFVHGHWAEGRAWLENALAKGTDQPGRTRLKALLGAAHLARQQGDYDPAKAMCVDGLRECRELREHELAAWFLLNLGIIAWYRDDSRQAAALFEESLATSRGCGDKWLVSMALAQLGGLIATTQSDLGRADALLEESLALSMEVGDGYRVAFAHRGLGAVALRQGDPETAAAHYRESLQLSSEVNEGWIIEESLVGLAGVARALDDSTRAARLFGAAEALRGTLGLHRLSADQADHDDRVAATRTDLGEAAFRAAWADGRAMTLEQATEYALAPTDAIRVQPKRTRARPSDTHVDLLAPREREVAALVAQGHTNREIAALLGIAERTAETHVQHILNKLGHTSRAQIAAWATEQGLHTSSPN